MTGQESGTELAARVRLLDTVIDHLTAHGWGSPSLRQLAESLGTSHRMLIYHFGSKDRLLVAVVQEVESRQRQALAELQAEAAAKGGSLADVMRRFWTRLADPGLWPHERLFFELYGLALSGQPALAPFLDRIVESWLEPATELARGHGVPEATARAHARLGLAVIRGLLLDLVATGDQSDVDAAMDLFVARYDEFA
jgi:AcrR family transcriptional regulator